ncbi:OmpA/MotB family protein [Xanthovirga aplysinae]|uniref:OmpA/MotB family protein n=1 Tax=Xanthovirga aplysinae TaxID=2529853 RepID=UPI0012BD701F|nr:OmpA family protein [Xanthovirga aplysinae]MTI29527.1 hypothetical protein [Xanthovirga aplysinae]
MTKNNRIGIILGLITLIAISSLSSGCVSQKVYDSTMAEKEKIAIQLAENQEELAISQKKIERLNEQLTKRTNEKEKQEGELKASREELTRIQKEKKELNELYESLKSNSGQLGRELSAKQKRLMVMEESLEQSMQQNNELSKDLVAREARVAELERLIAEKEAAVNSLKQKVSQALLSFKESDLKVHIKNGKVYVSLNEQLLFKSGSIIVDPAGIKALKQLAAVLKEQAEINVLVEGHTDNVGISRTSKYMQDNWDLSVMRATSIVRILTNAGVDPIHITAAGRGEFSPLTSNESTEGKQQNRRTEIILTPNLDELFEIMASTKE